MSLWEPISYDDHTINQGCNSCYQNNSDHSGEHTGIKMCIQIITVRILYISIVKYNHNHANIKSFPVKLDGQVSLFTPDNIMHQLSSLKIAMAGQDCVQYYHNPAGIKSRARGGNEIPPCYLPSSISLQKSNQIFFRT